VSDIDRFLSLLAPESDRHLFLTIAESPWAKANLPRIRLHEGRFEHLAEELNLRNTRGCGVHLAVNELDAADPKKRTAANVRRIRVVWQEDDDGWRGEFPLAPSIVIQTSPGRFHRYWLVEGYWPADDDGRSDFSAVMAGMVANHGSDPNPIDICRALRVPGFKHMKEASHLVELLDDNGQRYTRERIVEAFAVTPEAITAKPDTGEAQIDWPRVIDALKVIPSDERPDWIKVGMALHHSYDGSDEGFEVWSDWSSASQKYDPREQQRHWNSFRDYPNPVTVASIFHLAKEHGWEEKPTVLPLPARLERRLIDHRDAGYSTARG
jgi:hypothetical protein